MVGVKLCYKKGKFLNQDLTRLLPLCYSVNKEMVKRYKTRAELESMVIRVFRDDYELLHTLAERHGWSIGEVVSLIIGSFGDKITLPDKVPAHKLQMPKKVVPIDTTQVTDDSGVQISPQQVISNGAVHVNPKTLRVVKGS